MVKHKMAILDNTGHTEVAWDTEVEQEVTDARLQFDQLKKLGYLGYSVPDGGEGGVVLKEFDPEAESIVMSPPMQGG